MRIVDPIYLADLKELIQGNYLLFNLYTFPQALEKIFSKYESSKFSIKYPCTNTLRNASSSMKNHACQSWYPIPGNTKVSPADS